MSRAAETNAVLAPSLGDDGRFELAMAAAAQEKRNRPVALPALAALILLASAVFAIWAVSSRNAALTARYKAESDQLAVEQMAEEWKTLSRQEKEAPGQVGERMPNLYSRMEALAREAGLKTIPANPRETPDTRGAIVVKSYAYTNVKDASLTALLEWVRKATEIPGMELTELRLKAEPQDWSVDVTFRRWERAG